MHLPLDSHAIKFNFVLNRIILTRLFPFPGFLLETAGVVFIAYGLITARSIDRHPRGGDARARPGPDGVRPPDPAPKKRSVGISLQSHGPVPVHGSPLLYSDRLVSITEEAITFRHYSLPFGSPRRVEFSDIDHFTCEVPTIMNGKYRIWGTGSFTVWYPLDSHRPERDRIFFATLTGRTMRIGFTVEDSSQVMTILSRKGLFIAGEGS